MEAIFFLIDIVGVVLMLNWSIENDRRGPDAPSIGLFAYREKRLRGSAKGNPRERGRSRRRGN